MALTIVLLPLFAAIIAGLFGNTIGDRASQFITCCAITLSAFLSILVFFFGLEVPVIELITWIHSGTFEAIWSLRIDTLTMVMMLVVTIVSAAVHWYSIGYMMHDPHKPRFMSYLSLFTFFMLLLITANDFIQLYVGWEGVGLCSYLLINFWYDKPTANNAAIKAFIVNRVGDFGFALGIMAIYFLFGTASFGSVFDATPDKAHTTFSFLGLESHALTVICLLLFMGAMGKSAQLGLHTWLPDAMEGPTPVSALIHAATMVTAGIFMVVRLSPLFEYAPIALDTIAIIGALTAFIAATIGLTQFDLKRIIAYSTMSQLGYMFLAVGVSAYHAAIFHLYTHAFFKALLFLSAGSVLHALSNEQDIRKMGGIWKQIPITYAMMWVGSLALAGIPFFSGFYSKDAILEAAYAAHTDIGFFAFWLGLITVPLTAFYSWRLLFMTFHGTPRADKQVMKHVHESPYVMTIPLAVLAVGALGAGIVSFRSFIGDGQESFWNEALVLVENGHHDLPSWVIILPTLLSVLGIGLAYLFYIYRTDLPSRCAQWVWPLDRLFANKWYFDTVYDRLIVKPIQILARYLWKIGDGMIIDDCGPNYLASTMMNFARRTSWLQSGYVFHYAFVMVIGIAMLVGWFYVKSLSG